MKKLKFIPVYLLFTVLCSIFLVSCSKDNSVTPPSNGPYQFDSSRYEWTTDTFYNCQARDILPIDSSYICIMDSYFLGIYDGKNLNRYFPNNCIFKCIDGYDRFNIYLGGVSLNGDFKFLKWNSFSFDEIPMPDSLEIGNTVNSIYVNSQSEIWLGTLNGRVYLYNGNGFIGYQIDTNLTVKYFTVDQYQNIFATCTRYVCENPNNIDCGIETNVYKFLNNNWKRIYSNLTPFNTPQFNSLKMNENLYGNMQNGIYQFSGSNFQEIVQVPIEYLFNMFVLGGKNSNQLSAQCVTTDFQSNYLINWNGNKWSIEIENPNDVIDIKEKNAKYYILTSDYNFGTEYFQTGSLK